MPTLAAVNSQQERTQKVRPTIKIDHIPSKEANEERPLVRNNSDVSLSVCIQHIPASPTQHAEYTLSLTPNSKRKKRRLRKQPVVDIHACFEVDDLDGAISVISDNDNYLSVDKHCTRYDRDSVDLLERYDQLHPDSEWELTHLTSANQQVSHATRFMLIEHSCSR